MYKLAETFPASEKFSLVQQLTRPAISIPSNIAEGSSRRSQKDYNRFVEILLGSCFKLERQLLLAKAANFGSAVMIDITLQKIDEEQKMLMSFATSFLINSIIFKSS